MSDYVNIKELSNDELAEQYIYMKRSLKVASANPDIALAISTSMAAYEDEAERRGIGFKED